MLLSSLRSSPLTGASLLVAATLFAGPRLTAQAPGSYGFFGGGGCQGSSGFAPLLTQTPGSTLTLGSTFSATVTNLPPSIRDAAVMLTSLLQTQQPPVTLGAIGMPGCSLFVSPQFADPLIKNGTSANWTLNISTDPALVGVRFFNQVVAFDNPLFGQMPNPFGAIVSNGASGTIGPAVIQRTIVESFDTQTSLDGTISSADWDNGNLEPGQIGGDGIHGAFDINLLPQDANGTFVWDVDAPLVIPSAQTLLNEGDLTIVDGQASFSEFEVNGATLRFIGSKAPVIRVAGRASIIGRVEVDGESGEDLGRTSNFAGAAGGQPGAGGGAGGRGAEPFTPSVPGATPINVPTAIHRGENGEDLQVAASSGYAGMTTGTGGEGAPWFPASGLHSSVNSQVPSAGPANLRFYSSQQIAGGGGGGGIGSPGQPGAITRALIIPPAAPTLPPAGGAAVPIALPPMGVRSVDHFLAGGSGGGGGGSASTMVRPGIISAAFMRWTNGQGGGGGGGALALRVGGDLNVAPSGTLSTRGGSGLDSLNNIWTSRGASAAGGGAGGTLLLQVGGTVSQLGTIDLSGGSGGRFTSADPTGTGVAESVGGDGAPGIVRLETTATQNLGNVVGATAVGRQFGPLTDRDPRSVARSQWYALPAVGPRTLQHYEIDAVIDGVPQMFTDSIANPNLANITGAPVQFLLQGADVDPATRTPLSTPTAWLEGVSQIAPSNPTGFRFLILLDTTVANSIVIEEVRFVYRG